MHRAGLSEHLEQGEGDRFCEGEWLTWMIRMWNRLADVGTVELNVDDIHPVYEQEIKRTQRIGN